MKNLGNDKLSNERVRTRRATLQDFLFYPRRQVSKIDSESLYFLNRFF